MSIRRPKITPPLVTTVASLIAEAEEVRVLAMAAGNFSAAIAAIREKGTLAGLRVERQETAHRTLQEMPDAELEAIASGRDQIH